MTPVLEIQDGHRDRVMAEIQRRANKARAKTSSIKFAQHVDDWHGYHAPHMRLIGDYIDRAIEGTLWDGMPGAGRKYLFINVPPSYGKTSFVSRKLPAYAVPRLKALGKPHQVILASYNSTLAETHNRKVLELMNTAAYKALFPHIKLSDREQNAQQWSLEGDPFTTVRAAGVGAGLTGYHAYMAIVDDPIKERSDANSPTMRERLWEWWADVLNTRIIGDGFILGMWTRWTEDDPQGRILTSIKEGKSDERVVVLRIPAMAETQAEREAVGKMGLPVDEADPLGRKPGEALWPDKHGVAELISIRRAYPVTWESLYQQKPRPVSGFVVGEKNFNLIPAMPKGKIRWVWGTDWAITEKQIAPKNSNDPDYTVAALVGLRNVDGSRENARLVIGFIKRGQLGQAEARQMVQDTVLSVEAKYPVRAGQDNIDKVALDNMRGHADMVGVSIQNLDRKELKGDKMTKALPWLEMAQSGRVDVVQGAWNEMFFREIENFPHGAHDDQVDAVSVAVAALGVKTVVLKKARSYQG